MPSLRSCGPPSLKKETRAPQSALCLLHLSLPSPLPAAISLHPSLPVIIPWRKKAQKPCPNHKALSSCQSRRHQSLRLIPRKSGMWSAQSFVARAPQPYQVFHQLALLLCCGSAAASVWQQTRRSVHTQSRRT